MSDIGKLRALIGSLGKSVKFAAEIREWMTAEAQAGRLRINSEAPAWRRYAIATKGEVDAAGGILALAPELLAVVEAHRRIMAMAVEMADHQVGKFIAQQLREHDAGALDALDAKLAEVMP